MTARVWYAAFGSNLSYDRFLVYLNGGHASGSVGSTPGARDSTAPTRSIVQFSSHGLRFGGQSTRWSGGGVAFLDSVGGVHRTALRLYDITAEQFEDVFQQENGLDEPIPIDLRNAEEKGWVDLTDRWYGRVLFLGRHDGLAIFTITSPNPPQLNPPHPSYLETIVTGLTTSVDGHRFPFADTAEAHTHLLQADGIRPDGQARP